MLYNRRTDRVREVTALASDLSDLHAGQVNGRWVTFGAYLSGPAIHAGIWRYNIRTFRTHRLTGPHHYRLWSGPSVGSDGTVYYLRDCAEPACTDLVRQPVGGEATVVATLPADVEEDGPSGHLGLTLGQTFVKDRPDGSKVVYATVGNDVYRVVDRGSAG